MKQARQIQQQQPSTIEFALQGRELQPLFRHVLLASLDAATADKRLLRNRSHLGTAMPSHLMVNLQQVLSPHGFFLRPDRNQLQLWSKAHYDVPICLRWCHGRYVNGIVLLAAEKGPVTRLGVNQNREHFHAQLDIFDQIPPLYDEVFNITLVWDLEGKRAQGWLVKPVEMTEGGTELLCDDHWIICDEEHEPKLGLRIEDQPSGTPQVGGDADYDLPFGERLAS